MEQKAYTIESLVPYSHSKLWEFNRKYYEAVGVDAWHTGEVPHHITSNSMVGMTYAKLIYALLSDLSLKGKVEEKVYLLELGAGHGRLCFHILKHLDEMIASSGQILPPYCYILSDISEKNLTYFEEHIQLKYYIDQGKLDVSYVDAVSDADIQLRISKKIISNATLTQPIVVIANYFFDSIPQELFYIKNKKVFECLVTLESDIAPDTLEDHNRMASLEVVFTNNEIDLPYFDLPFLDDILKYYVDHMQKTYLLLPHAGLQCIERIKSYSKEGMMLITMDKGDHEKEKIDGKDKPDYITHGSFSTSVNYHAFSLYAEQNEGLALFPTYSNFHLELGCLIIGRGMNNYPQIKAAYHHEVDIFGPDDFYGLSKMSYLQINDLKIQDFIHLNRLSNYDSVFFQNNLPGFKKAAKEVSHEERKRVHQTLLKVWDMFFIMQEPFDMAFEMAGIFFDLGYYDNALQFFNHSIRLFGETEDVMFNKGLVLYQLRRDVELLNLISSIKVMHPHFLRVADLENLEM